MQSFYPLTSTPIKKPALTTCNILLKRRPKRYACANRYTTHTRTDGDSLSLSPSSFCVTHVSPSQFISLSLSNSILGYFLSSLATLSLFLFSFPFSVAEFLSYLSVLLPLITSIFSFSAFSLSLSLGS